MKALNEKVMPIGAKMYEQEQSDKADEAKEDDDPIEGEVVEEDKKDKK